MDARPRHRRLLQNRAFLGGPPSGGLTRDHILDNITLYWLTGTGVSAARAYWEGQNTPAAGGPPPPVRVPVGFTTFPGEIFPAPRACFAAWEEPELFATEVRAAFRSLR